MSEHPRVDDEAAGTAALIFEDGTLRDLPRTGWRYDGISHAETVAEHSHRTAFIGILLAAMEGADPARTTMLCVLHDFHEARIGDLTPISRRYVTAADPLEVTADQVSEAHPAVQAALLGAVTEFEADETLEARCAHDADKLDCLIRAREYQVVGFPTQGKIERCRAALRTNSAQRLADVAVTMDLAQWQSGLRRAAALS
ncbi:HD domain-containing protein [Kitasatospora sp. LaBMicrA B282]|uniref:HD domain-containing protein n=1 Tax=Kitasatospora sp. LaBMicrA B282 TaxID=3420949 RepID=UPI003D0F4223